MAKPIVIAISFPSATNAKPKKNPALVLLVKAKRLSVPESVTQKRGLLPKPLRYTKAERRLARPPIVRRKPRMKSMSRDAERINNAKLQAQTKRSQVFANAR